MHSLLLDSRAAAIAATPAAARLAGTAGTAGATMMAGTAGDATMTGGTGAEQPRQQQQQQHMRQQLQTCCGCAVSAVVVALMHGLSMARLTLRLGGTRTDEQRRQQHQQQLQGLCLAVDICAADNVQPLLAGVRGQQLLLQSRQQLQRQGRGAISASSTAVSTLLSV
jgi:hypothetical protein